jgi:hypothetical protein
MDPATILALIQLASKLIETGTQLYEDSKSTLSETDIATIKANLAKVQALTAAYRTEVDTALDEAATK